ncbi:hypothetical protein [Stieleria magnilauensis]|uniref:Uncharacterized protein n=1 Tax=Stieleria magnilauensis TaxID=2527963 RepID=A0ABX5XK95_9BACT|nr:hypothetical protein TBK1r_13400 [Planctomycetes bacterium TBK1r]
MPGKSNQQRPTPLDPPRPRRVTRRKRLATAAAVTLAALGLAAADQTLPEAHADHPATMQRLGRLLGVGWGDGYHVCRDGGFRPGADLPPHGYPDQFGHASCRDGCGQIYPPGTGLSQVHSGLPHLLTGLPSLPAVSGPVVYPSGVAPCNDEGCDASIFPSGNPPASCDDAGCDTALDSHDFTATGNSADDTGLADTGSADAGAPPTESDEAMELPQDWTVEQDVPIDDEPSDDKALETSEPHVVEPNGIASPSDQSMPFTVTAPKVKQPLLDFSGPNQLPFASADSDPADAGDQFGGDPLDVEPDLLNDEAIEQQLPPSAYFRGDDDLGLEHSGTADLVAPQTELPETELPVQLPSVQMESPPAADAPEVEAPTVDAPAVTAPPIRSNPFLGTGLRSAPSTSRNTVPRVATLPHAAPTRDWNPIHQPD